MKLGITLFIIGIVIAGLGMAAWQWGESQSYLFGTFRDELPRIISSVGLGALVIGGGLSLGGLVTMIIRRSDD